MNFREQLKNIMVKDEDFKKAYNDANLKLSYEDLIDGVVDEVLGNIEAYTLDKKYVDHCYSVINGIIVNFDEIMVEFESQIEMYQSL